MNRPRTRVYFLGIALIAFSVAAVATRAPKPVMHSVKMFSCSGLPCVDLKLQDGTPLRMAIDTGDEDSIVDRSTAARLSLDVEHPTSPDGKPAGDDYVVLHGVTLGDLPLGDVRISVLDGIAARMKRDRMPTADGLIAYTAFKARLLELDYPHHVFRLSPPLHKESCLKACADLLTPTFGRRGPAVLVSRGYSINGQPVVAQIDTLFSGTMLIYSTSIEKLGLSAASQTSDKEFFKYTDGGVEMLRSKAKSLGFGKHALAHDVPLYFPTQAVHQPDGMFDAAVGQALFQRFVLHLDLRNMKVWMS